jgi:UDP-glucuronate 4-epimerase
MRVLVTGAAGFIGSHLCEALAARGDVVIGVDSFSDYYSREEKERNASCVTAAGCDLIEADLIETDLLALLSGVDAVFHQAGQPGVRSSWAAGFDRYLRDNVLGTQRLLEAARVSDVSRFVFASSSSIYGDLGRFPTLESDLPRPTSPYGVSKLAAEQLCGLYGANWGLSTVSLRYFTVFGPRQRPDMAIRRVIESCLFGSPFQLFGDGEQVRDFTYVDDVVQANLLASIEPVRSGSVMNIAGGGALSMKELIHVIEGACSSPAVLEHSAAVAGDVLRTGGSTDAARNLLGWRPEWDLEEGVRAEIDWVRTLALG